MCGKAQRQQPPQGTEIAENTLWKVAAGIKAYPVAGSQNPIDSIIIL